MAKLKENLKAASDYIGVGLIGLLWGASFYSVYLNIRSEGIDGLLFGRFFGQLYSGDHTMAIFAVLIPMTLFIKKAKMNLLLGFGLILFADYFHESAWNIPYYVYYGLGDYALQWFVPLLGCFLFFYMSGIWRKKEYSITPFAYLLIWFAVITSYLVLTNGGLYSANVLNPALSDRYNIAVNFFEIDEVALFSILLYYALAKGLEKGKTVILKWVIY